MENFPQYRFLSNKKTIYKILDSKSFEEKQRMGSKVYFFKMTATQYPEMLRIKDMLDCNESLYEVAFENDWLNF